MTLSDLTFDADWLALREGFDHAARDNAVMQAAVAWAEARPHDRPLEIADLGAGSGSNLRFLAPRLAPAQNWTLIDHDERLLAVALKENGFLHSPHDRPVSLRTRHADLTSGCEEETIAKADLMTAAALIDLVSADWLDGLIDLCAARQVALLLVLTYDGRMDWRPPLPDDDTIKASFNAHQRQDKGFGPALGPTAQDHAVQRLASLGYRTVVAESDWRIGPTETEMLSEMARGCAMAASDMSPGSADRITTWRAQRLDGIATDDTRLTIGHQDLFAVPA